MNLCSEYIEKIITNDKRFIVVKGDYKHIYVQLYFNIGAYNDYSNAKGISHLCEHIFIAEITKRYLTHIDDEDYSRNF